MPLIGISFVAPSKAGKPSQSQRPESRSQNQKLYRPAGQVFETHAVVIIHDRQAEPNCANSCCQSKHTEPEPSSSKHIYTLLGTCLRSFVRGSSPYFGRGVPEIVTLRHTNDCHASTACFRDIKIPLDVAHTEGPESIQEIAAGPRPEFQPCPGSGNSSRMARSWLKSRRSGGGSRCSQRPLSTTWRSRCNFRPGRSPGCDK